MKNRITSITRVMICNFLLLLLLSALVENGAGTGWTVKCVPSLFIVLFVLTLDIKTLLDAGNSSNLMVRN
jgi:hypothetical protein